MKLSYLVATFDCPTWLDLHISDLLNRQNDPDFEIVVVHHGSPSYDRDVGEKWANIDSRVRNIDDVDFGCYGPAWITAWKNARADFVVNSNTDDFHEPDFTSEFHKHMSFATSGMHAGRKIGFAYAGIRVVDESGILLGGGVKPPFDFEVMSRECWAGPQVCWRNDEKFKSSLDWDLIDRRSKEYRSAFDYWLWLYFMSLGYNGYVIPKILTIYTQRAGSVENSNKSANNYETYSAISEFFGHNFKGHLKHAIEFEDFNNRPPREEWIATMQAGKKWKA